TAFALALTIKIYEKYGTIELDEILKKEDTQ
ncbi:MAG: cation:proton antiporter, partial [Clostridium cochlearium]|nr:cation:proton antiporter [Clostridium cochlearium]